MNPPETWAVAAAMLLEHGPDMPFTWIAGYVETAVPKPRTRTAGPTGHVVMKEILDTTRYKGRKVFQAIGEGYYVLKDEHFARRIPAVLAAIRREREREAALSRASRRSTASQAEESRVGRTQALSAPLPKSPSGNTLARQLETCRTCGARVRPDRMQRHMRRRHQAQQARPKGRPVEVPAFADRSPRAIFENPLVEGASPGLANKKVRGDHK